MTPVIINVFSRLALSSILAFTFMFGQEVNLSQEALYFKKGFNPEWVLEQPGDEKGWMAISNLKYKGFPAYADIEYPDKVVRKVFSYKNDKEVQFSILVPFDFEHIEENTPYSLTIKSLSFYWEIYLNGVLINSNWQSGGHSASPVQGKNLTIALPTAAIQKENNRLVFRIKGPPNHRWTGFYYAGPVKIVPAHLKPIPNDDLLMLSMLSALVLFALFWVVVAFVDQKFNLYVFAGWCITYALFFFTLLDHLWQIQFPGYHLVRVAHITFYLSSIIYPLFIDTYNNRISLFTKWFVGSQALFILIAIIAPLRILFDINYVWQRMTVLPIGYVMFQAAVYYKSFGSQRVSRFVQSGLGIIFLAMLIHAAFSVRDIIELMLNHRDNLLSRYTMVLSTLIISVVLGREFIQRYVQSRGLGEQLAVETEKKNLELRQAKDYLEYIFESSGEGIAVFDLKINIIQCNQAYLDIFGYTFEEYKNLSIEDLYDGEGGKMLLGARKKALKSGLLRLIVSVITKAGDRRKISITGKQTESPSGQKIFITNVFDLTERIEMENRLRKSKTDLEKSEEKLLLLVDRLNDQSRDLRKTSGRILEAQENERGRISRELHDEVGQTLTAIDLNLERLRNSKDNHPAVVGECQSLVRNTSKEIHRFSRDLRPVILDDMGLFPAILSFIRSFEKRTNINVNFEPPEVEKPFSTHINILLYRIFQEALTNASKHSRANTVSIKYGNSDESILLLFSDDGVGFSGDYVNKSSSHLGLQGIDERVKLAGGHFSVSSLIEGGAQLNIEIPINEV